MGRPDPRPRLHGPAPSADSTLKIRIVLQILADDGWILARQRGSHRQFRHPWKPGIVTVAGKPSDDLAPKTRKSIFKQARLNP
jgi:predicted RNA binding protein YcfA (HicA-like mRNA interferase family)